MATSIVEVNNDILKDDHSIRNDSINDVSYSEFGFYNSGDDFAESSEVVDKDIEAENRNSVYDDGNSDTAIEQFHARYDTKLNKKNNVNEDGNDTAKEQIREQNDPNNSNNDTAKEKFHTGYDTKPNRKDNVDEDGNDTAKEQIREQNDPNNSNNNKKNNNNVNENSSAIEENNQPPDYQMKKSNLPDLTVKLTRICPADYGLNDDGTTYKTNACVEKPKNDTSDARKVTTIDRKCKSRLNYSDEDDTKINSSKPSKDTSVMSSSSKVDAKKNKRPIFADDNNNRRKKQKSNEINTLIENKRKRNISSVFPPDASKKRTPRYKKPPKEDILRTSTDDERDESNNNNRQKTGQVKESAAVKVKNETDKVETEKIDKRRFINSSSSDESSIVKNERKRRVKIRKITDSSSYISTANKKYRRTDGKNDETKTVSTSNIEEDKMKKSRGRPVKKTNNSTIVALSETEKVVINKISNEDDDKKKYSRKKPDEKESISDIVKAKIRQRSASGSNDGQATSSSRISSWNNLNNGGALSKSLADVVDDNKMTDDNDQLGNASKRKDKTIIKITTSDEVIDRIKEEVSKKSKSSTTTNNKNNREAKRDTDDDDPELIRLKRSVRVANLRIHNYEEFFADCHSIKSKRNKIVKFLEENGLKDTSPAGDITETREINESVTVTDNNDKLSTSAISTILSRGVDAIDDIDYLVEYTEKEDGIGNDHAQVLKKFKEIIINKNRHFEALSRLTNVIDYLQEIPSFDSVHMENELNNLRRLICDKYNG